MNVGNTSVVQRMSFIVTVHTFKFGSVQFGRLMTLSQAFQNVSVQNRQGTTLRTVNTRQTDCNHHIPLVEATSLCNTAHEFDFRFGRYCERRSHGHNTKTSASTTALLAFHVVLRSLRTLPGRFVPIRTVTDQMSTTTKETSTL